MIHLDPLFTIVPGGDSAPDGGFSTTMMIMLGWLVMATALFLLRPSRLRNQGDGKPANNVSFNPLYPFVLLVRDSQEVLYCVFEKDTLSSA